MLVISTLVILLFIFIFIFIFISNPGKCIFLLKSIWSRINSKYKVQQLPKTKTITIPFYFKLLEYDVSRRGWICVGFDNSAFFSELFIEWREYPSFEEITNFDKRRYLSRAIKRDLLRNCQPASAVDLRHSDKIYLKGWEEMKMNEALE